MANLTQILRAFSPLEIEIIDDLLTREVDEATANNIPVPEALEELHEIIKRASCYKDSDR